MNTQTLQIGSYSVSVQDIFPMLHRYQVMPQVLRGIVIDHALTQWEQIHPWRYTEAEQNQAVEQFWQQQQVTTPEDQAAWLETHHLTPEQLIDLALRPLKLEQFKATTWSNKISSYFLSRKQDLDQVVYSLIRTTDSGLANELYFRLLEGEAAFEDLACQHSQGAEAETGGRIGPVPLSKPHPMIRKMLTLSQPGQLWSPQAIEGWAVLVRLEQYLPVSLDESMQQHLLNELFELWLQEELQKRV